jgi:hypothetical protein
MRCACVTSKDVNITRSCFLSLGRRPRRHRHRRRRCRRRCAARARASSASCEQDTPAFPLCVIGAVLTPFCVLLLTRPIFIGPQQPPPGADQTTKKTTAVYVSAPQHPHCSLWATRLSGWQIILRLMRTLQSDRTQAAAPHSVWECASA